MLKEGSVLFYSGENKPVFQALVEAVTGCPMTHVVIYSKGFYYEANYCKEKGHLIHTVRKFTQPKRPLFIKNFYYSLNYIQTKVLNTYLEKQIGKRYNIMLLLNMWWIYRLRWLWKRMKWCPFQKKTFGFICSNLIDKAYNYIGIDLIPDQYNTYTTPCDLFNCKKLVFSVIGGISGLRI